MHTLVIDGLNSDLRVIQFSGTEGISELFCFDVTFVVDAPVDFGSVTGKPALLTIRSGNDVRFVHGMVSRLEHAAPTRAHGSYRVTLLPLVHRLRLRKTSRIFQDESVKDIAEKVFG